MEEESKKKCVECNISYSGKESKCGVCGAPLVVSVDPLLGKEIDGRFKIIEVLGSGGMGTVYKAYQPLLDREIAVKVIKRELSEDETVTRRFLKEARASSKLSHPNIIMIYDFGRTADGLLYIMMELLKGKSLSKVIEQEKNLSVQRVIHISNYVCDALSNAHEKGIVHRDLKPENIFLIEHQGDKDFVKILDFGLAKIHSPDDKLTLTKTGSICGTPYYMSPEQARGDEIDYLSDIYSLGTIIYEMFSGTPPFVGKSAMMIMMAHLNQEPLSLRTLYPDLNIPEPLDKLILKSLSKDKSLRPQSALIFKQQLLDCGRVTFDETDFVKTDVMKIDTGEIISSSQRESETILLKEVTEEEERKETEEKPPFKLKKFPYSYIYITFLSIIIISAMLYFIFSGKKKEDIKKSKVLLSNLPEKRYSELIPVSINRFIEEKKIKSSSIEYAKLTINSEPSKSTVYEENKIIGVTPLVVQMRIGEQKLHYTIKKKGFVSKDIYITPDKNKEVKVQLEKIKKGPKFIEGGKEDKFIHFGNK